MTVFTVQYMRAVGLGLFSPSKLPAVVHSLATTLLVNKKLMKNAN